MKKIITLIITLLIFAGGYTMGRYNTIYNAELLGVTAQEYYISFDKEVHAYVFE